MNHYCWAPLTLKEYITQHKQDKEIFDLKERHDIRQIRKRNCEKYFFNSQVVKIFKFVVGHNINNSNNGDNICIM